VHKPVLTSWIAGLAACLPLTAAAGPTLVPELPSIAQLTPGNGSPIEARVLEPSLGDPPAASVTAGAFEGHFLPFTAHGSHRLTAPLWFRLAAPAHSSEGSSASIPVLLARAGMDQSVQVFARRGGDSVSLSPATVVPQFGGAQDTVFVLPPGLDAGQPL
jgi:hypothetical protein